jgi:protocatechuate 3,4-dioxygenase beta subunit
MRRVAAATLILSAVALLARAQSLSITGRVVADETGEPIANARVTLAAAAQGTPVVLTDPDGRFALIAAAGRPSLVASKSGYARSELTPAAGEAIAIRLRRAAAISGRVVDEFGDPIVNARVAAETRVGSQTNLTAVATTDSDDRGEFRLAGLPAGTFAVTVVTMGVATPQTVDGNQIISLPDTHKTYYPGAAALNEAQELRLQYGEDRPGIDFVVSAKQSDGQPYSVMRVSPLRPPPPDPAARATSIVRGRVSSTDGHALPHAQVRLFLQGNPLQTRTGRADSDGRFEFLDLPAGKYRIVAAKTGYSLEGAAVFAGPPLPTTGQPVDVAEAETHERVDITLARWGSLAGHVFDELGDPLQDASVQLLRVRYEAGRRRLVATGGAVRVTDDLGRYRLYAVPPGQYIVSAAVGAVRSADLPGYTRSYFPGTPNPGEAQFVSIGLSQDIAGIDFSLARTRTARVAGKVLNAASEPTTAGSLRLITSQRSTSVTSVPVGARILSEGRFEFPNVPPGQYVIQADRGRSNSWTEGEFGTLPVSVDGADVTDLIVHTSTGSAIAGRFTFDTYNGAKAPATSAIELSPAPVDFDLAPPQVAASEIHADWTFEIAGVNGPRRLQLLRVPPEWALKEILVGHIDITDRPLPFGRKDQSLTGVEVVLTDRINELSGTIADDSARPAPGSSLIVFSTDHDRWYPASRFLRKAVAGAEGAARIAGLPPGSYYAAAVAQLPVDGEDGWQDPAFLATLLARASTVTFGDGQKRLLDLRLPAR